jgi:CrcB protein
MSLQNLLLVAVGGAIGSVCRYLVAVGAMRLFGPDFPWGTLAVNVAGSLLMGMFVEMLALRFDGSQALRLFVAVGFLGGFTTLSSFSLDAYVLWERGAVAAAAGYVAASLVLSLAGLVAGLSIVRILS